MTQFAHRLPIATLVVKNRSYSLLLTYQTATKYSSIVISKYAARVMSDFGKLSRKRSNNPFTRRPIYDQWLAAGRSTLGKSWTSQDKLSPSLFFYIIAFLLYEVTEGHPSNS